MFDSKRLTIIAGPCSLENEEMCFQVAEFATKVTAELGIDYIFKGSFDKANRTSSQSFRGNGMEHGLSILSSIRKEFNVPVLTDIHDPKQAESSSKIADILQLPAFLSRQTDLIIALAKTKSIINIKKAQFLAPKEMLNIIKKFEHLGNNKLIICERGTSFGYNNLVVDLLGFSIMKKLNAFCFSATVHSKGKVLPRIQLQGVH